MGAVGRMGAAPVTVKLLHHRVSSESMAGMSDDRPKFGHFYCSLYVESICALCYQAVAKALTRKDLKPREKLHTCPMTIPRVHRF